jgi:NAD(P)-dependent dehydrogenase (short-subunit alcohol dehydrogenase family)
MARIFITGSSDGLGSMAARLLVDAGHRVVLHARNEARRRDALAAVPGAEAALVADLASQAQTKALAGEVNALGAFDAVIHNAALGYRESRRIETEDGLPQLFAVNSLAPYILTALIAPPHRLVYVSSGLHRSGDPTLQDLTWSTRRWDGLQAYSDSKLHNVLLARAAARRWPDTLSNSIEPGWVATKMGGAGASDDLDLGPRTQVWLASSDDAGARVSGRHFYHGKPMEVLEAACDEGLQDSFIAECERLSGIALPASAAPSPADRRGSSRP